MPATNRLRFLLLAFLLAQAWLCSAQGDWEFKGEKNGIILHWRDVPNSEVKQLKMNCTVAAPSLSAFAALFEDLDNLHNWAYANYDSRLLKQISRTEIIYYVKADFPWPMSNRDFILHNWCGQDSVTGAFYSVSKAKPTFIEEDEDLIRVYSFESYWTVLPLGDALYAVEAIIGSDPGGNIPAWLINLFIDVGPAKTIKALRAEVKREKYATATVPYITEPEEK